MARNLYAALKDRHEKGDPRGARNKLRLLTLTLKHNDDGLGKQLRRLRESWNKLRELTWFKNATTGGVAFVEIKTSERTNRWHPHLHVILEGGFLAQAEVSKAWLRITGDSFVIDIRGIRNVAECCSYVAKYAAKAISPTVWKQPDKLQEAIVALAGSRTFATFGSFTGFKLSEPPPDDCGWIAIAPLHVVLQRAASGDADSVHLLRSLKGCVPDANVDREIRDGPEAPMPDLSM